MNRLEAWLLHISTILLTLTGGGYAYLHYIVKPSDPFAVVNHPLELPALKFHIIIAPLLLLAVGIITHAHILWKMDNQTRIARRSGILLIPLFLLMTLSGYFLQVIGSEFRKTMVVIHLATGALWFILYVAHQVASWSFRRSLNGRPSGMSRA